MATWAELRAELQSELDLEDEDFISDSELLSLVNTAIGRVESLVLNLNEDYFLAEPVPLTLVEGQTAYVLPLDIYAQKIREIIFDDGTENYEVKRIKEIKYALLKKQGERYGYLITNSGTNGVKLNIYPAPSEAGNLMTLWYLRNVNRVTQDSDVLDLPEAYGFLKQFLKDACVNKERFDFNNSPSPALQAEQDAMLTSLHQRFVDEENFESDELQEYIEEVGC